MSFTLASKAPLWIQVALEETLTSSQREHSHILSHFLLHTLGIGPIEAWVFTCGQVRETLREP